MCQFHQSKTIEGKWNVLDDSTNHYMLLTPLKNRRDSWEEGWGSKMSQKMSWKRESTIIMSTVQECDASAELYQESRLKAAGEKYKLIRKRSRWAIARAVEHHGRKLRSHPRGISRRWYVGEPRNEGHEKMGDILLCVLQVAGRIYSTPAEKKKNINVARVGLNCSPWVLN
jgi:hypothetical protein